MWERIYEKRPTITAEELNQEAKKTTKGVWQRLMEKAGGFFWSIWNMLSFNVDNDTTAASKNVDSAKRKQLAIYPSHYIVYSNSGNQPSNPERVGRSHQDINMAFDTSYIPSCDVVLGKTKDNRTFSRSSSIKNDDDDNESDDDLNYVKNA